MLFTKNYFFSPLFTATCLESRTPCCWLKLFEIYDAARGLGHTIVVTSALNKKITNEASFAMGGDRLVFFAHQVATSLHMITLAPGLFSHGLPTIMMNTDSFFACVRRVYLPAQLQPNLHRW